MYFIQLFTIYEAVLLVMFELDIIAIFEVIFKMESEMDNQLL